MRTRRFRPVCQAFVVDLEGSLATYDKEQLLVGGRVARIVLVDDEVHGGPGRPHAGAGREADAGESGSALRVPGDKSHVSQTRWPQEFWDSGAVGYTMASRR